MSKIEFLPLGSIVIVKGAIKKTMIIARGVAMDIGGGIKYFDYAGCIYPEGLIGDQLLYFNHEDIAKEIFNGFSDDDEILMVENINNWTEKCGYQKGKPYDLNMEKIKNKENN